MKNISKNLTIFVIFSFVFIFLGSSKVDAAVTTWNGTFQNSAPSSSYKACPDTTGCSSAPQGSYCWNNATPGSSNACGNTCTGGASWTRYTYDGCYLDPATEGSLEQGCLNWFHVFSTACSTADKYNDRYSEGDTTMLRAGGCLCETKSLFKTCCNGTNVAQTYQAGGNPNFPDGGCSFTTKACGPDPTIYAELGQPFTNVSCGQAACGGTCTAGQACTGPGGCPGTTSCPNGPSGASSCVCSVTNYNCVNGTTCQSVSGPGQFPTLNDCNAACNTQCPNYAPPAQVTQGSCAPNTTCFAQQSSAKRDGSCRPGDSCTRQCAFTCRDALGRTCPALTCQTTWACDAAGSGYVNDGRYYYTCPSSCPDCPVGATQTVCGTEQNKCRIP